MLSQSGLKVLRFKPYSLTHLKKTFLVKENIYILNFPFGNQQSLA